MRKGDLIWGIIFAVFMALLVLPGTNKVYVGANIAHPFLLAFLQFFILATMGELLGRRIAFGKWIKPVGLLARALIWGIIGIMIMLTFNVFAAGVVAIMAKGLLPGAGSHLATAFYTSIVANITFGPVFMVFHRFSDTFIEMKYSTGSSPTLSEMINVIDWSNLFSFVILKTIPYFWIPAHTLTFYLPEEYRVVCAALLSVVVGTILSLANKRKAARSNLSEVLVGQIR